MKAIHWLGEKRFQLQDVATPTIGPGEVLVRVEAAAICGSDLHLADFKDTPPLIPGHEVAGTAVEVGSDVDSIAVDDRVALDPVQRCGDCWCCRNGVEHLCTNCRHLGTTQAPGGWAEYVAVDAANANRLPETVEFAAASLLEPAAVCYQSFQRAKLVEGQSVLIIGDGPFGFLHTQIARAQKAGVIVVAGHYDNRLERIVDATGAIACNTHHEDLTEVLAAHVGPPGVDVAIEATGAGPAPGLGIDALRPQGTLVVFSYIWSPEVLDMGLIHMRELNLLGSCRSQGAYGPCLELMGEGAIDTGALVDVEAPLADSNEAIARLSADKGNVFKAILRP